MKTDIERLLTNLDELSPSRLRSEITRRTGAGLEGPVPEPPGPARRLTAGVVAVAVFVAAVGFAWTLYIRHRPMEAQVSTDPWSWVDQGWSELPAPPEWRGAAAAVWTGSELLYWGSWPRGSFRADARPDGYAFDAVSRTWSTMPSGPQAFASPHGIWTGHEAIFWDGSDVLGFDPATEQWRAFPPALHAEPGHVAVWTGNELIFWGGGPKGSDETRSGAALDMSTGTWHSIADAPAGLNLVDAVWTGSQMVVVGSEIDNENHATTETSIAMTYDPTDDLWRRLPDPPVSAQTAAVADVNGHLVVWELYSPAAAELIPGEDSWRSLDMGGLRGSECYAQGATLGDVLFTWDCGDPAAWYGGTSPWVRTGLPRSGMDAGFTYSFGAVYAAGPVAVIEHVETVDQDGTPYVGSSDAPVHLWVWRPAATPLSTHLPDASDAELLAGSFVSASLYGPEQYLSGYATSDLLERMRSGTGVPPDFLDRSQGSVRFVDPDHLAQALGAGRFEVRVARKGGSVFRVVLGPGRTADGRDAQLVVTDVRAID